MYQGGPPLHSKMDALLSTGNEVRDCWLLYLCLSPALYLLEYVSQIVWSTHGLFGLCLALQRRVIRVWLDSWLVLLLSMYKSDSEVRDCWLLYLCPSPSLYLLDYVGELARRTPVLAFMAYKGESGSARRLVSFDR